MAIPSFLRAHFSVLDYNTDCVLEGPDGSGGYIFHAEGDLPSANRSLEVTGIAEVETYGILVFTEQSGRIFLPAPTAVESGEFAALWKLPYGSDVVALHLTCYEWDKTPVLLYTPCNQAWINTCNLLRPTGWRGTAAEV